MMCCHKKQEADGLMFQFHELTTSDLAKVTGGRSPFAHYYQPALVRPLSVQPLVLLPAADRRGGQLARSQFQNRQAVSNNGLKLFLAG